MTASTQLSAQTGLQPTVVLVHGAFADASSWNGVIERLQLRGVAADSAYLASVVNQLDGPVLLAGHSDGGAVTTNAATDATGVVGLVYVAAFAPDEGEVLGDVAARSKDTLLMTAQVQRGSPTGRGGETAPEFLVDPGRFREVFAADLPAEQAAVLAATQPPVAAAAFSDVSGPPAWKSLPSWAVIATADKAAGSDVVRSMAQRAGADTVEVEGSHVIMVSQPQSVVDLIVKAARAVRPSHR